MSFNHNCSKTYLLINKPVIFIDEETNQTFQINLPTLEAFYTNQNLLLLLSILEKDLFELEKIISNVKLKDSYDFIHIVFSLSEKVIEFNKLKKELLIGLCYLNNGFNFNKILRINDIIITPEIFNLIVDVIFMSLDKEKTKINEKDDEFTRMEKEAKMRAERIRKNSKKEDKDSLNDMLIAILYEFPQYQLKDLFQLNVYTIYYLFKYVGKIANYEVSKIAAGNGLAKKHKYFIEK